MNKSSEPKPRKKFTLKPWRATANIPGEMREIIEERIAQLRYDGVAEYLLSVVVYDLYCGREHLLTGPLMREPKYIREAVLMELLDDVKSGANEGKKPGGWFEHRIKELVDQARKAK